MQDEAMGGSNFYNDNDRTPGNSNYLGPWPVYAFDWCKWPVHGNNSAGKMAVGSYLEDTHNFVSHVLLQTAPLSTPWDADESPCR